MCSAAFEQLVQGLLERSYEDPTTGCLIWTGAIHGYGYGVKWWNGKIHSIHRLVYIQFTGEEPEAVMHKCDTPRCWNFLHLVGGTYYDNIQDKKIKGREPLGTQRSNAKLNEDIVREIRSSALSQRALSRKYGVSLSTIQEVVYKITWRHVE